MHFYLLCYLHMRKLAIRVQWDCAVFENLKTQSQLLEAPQAILTLS